MLFIIDNAGVPSVAKMIKLQPKPAVKGASSDFNGDKFSDAVVADPHADPGGVADAGHVSVLYGNSSVLGGGSVDTLVQGSGAVGNTASAGDRFGSTLAAADLDLAPERARSPTAAHSTLSTISTPESWLGKRTTRTSSAVPGTPENNDAFGQVLDSVRVGSTTHLAVGIPSEDIGSAADAGSVQLFSSTGTTITPGVGLTQDITNVADTAEAGAPHSPGTAGIE